MQTPDPQSWQSEINVTPLVDVVLVLLIIFMVVIPLTLRGHDVDVPGPAVATDEVDRTSRQIVLTIDPRECPVLEAPSGAGLPDGCLVRLDESTLPVRELAGRTAELFAERHGEERVLFLVADDRLNYEAVMRIVDAAQSSVADLRIGLVSGADDDGSVPGGVAPTRS